MAQYLSNHDLKNIKAGDIMTERDITFRPDLESKREAVDIDVLDVCPYIAFLVPLSVSKDSLGISARTIPQPPGAPPP